MRSGERQVVWMRAVAIPAFLVLLVVGCWHGSPVTYPLVAIKAAREERQTEWPIRVDVGQEFVNTIESNRATGYQWRLTQPPPEHIARVVGSAYEAGEGSRPGAGGVQRWTFKAVGPGLATIVLKYVRPWEGEGSPVRTETIDVVVR